VIPTGTVQFSADGSPIGSPATLSASGTATLNYTGLSLGTHSITAAYTPSGNFNASSTTTPGSVDVVLGGPTVVRAATLGGSAKVGGVLVCSTGTFAGATSYTYAFLRNGVAQANPTNSFSKTLLVSDFNTTYACRVTGTNPIGSVISTTAGIKIAAGSAAVARVKPRIIGLPRVGRVLLGNRGTWSPVATYSYTYTWKRNGVIVSRAINYKATALDKNKFLTLTVTAARPGYLTGTSVSLAVRVL
jgi:hypothetical protein